MRKEALIHTYSALHQFHVNAQCELDLLDSNLIRTRVSSECLTYNELIKVLKQCVRKHDDHHHHHDRWIE